MDRFGVRQFLEIGLIRNFRLSSETMDFTEDRVRAVETPSTPTLLMTCRPGTFGCTAAQRAKRLITPALHKRTSSQS
jgi:hypothetical protein